MKQRKSFRSVLSLILALIMIVSLPMAAFADGTVDNGDGTSTTTITNSSEPVTDAEGNVTITVTVHQNTTTNDPTANPQVSSESTTTTTTTTNPDGEEIYKQECGSTTETTVTADKGATAGQPEINLDLEIGQTTTAQGGVVVGEPEGDLPEGEDDLEYDYSQTTTVDRTATGSVSDIVVDEHIGEGDLKLETPELKDLGNPSDDKDGVSGGKYGKRPMNTSRHFDTVVINGVTTYVPRYNRTPEEMEKMPELLKGGTGYQYKPVYVKDESGNDLVDENGNKVIDYYTPNPASHGYDKDTGLPKAKEFPSGAVFDAAYGTNAEVSDYVLFFEDPIIVYDQGVMVYNNHYHYNNSGNLLLYDVYGNPIVTYCLDKETGTYAGTSTYVIENLDDADYFSGTEEEQAEKKAHVAAIATHGYWGTSSETKEQGSLAKIQEELKAFIEANEDFKFDYVQAPSYENSSDHSKVDTLSVEKNKEELLDLVDLLNEGAALAATQWAFWTYGNRDVNPVVGAGDPYNKSGNSDAMARAMALMHAWLLSDELKEASPNTANTIVDASVIDSMTLTIGDKVADAAENKDESHDNDVYNTELSFTMEVNEEKDDLVVTLIDSNGNVIRKARIAGTATEEDSLFSKLFRKDEKTNTYTFEDLQLAENSDITFDLKIDGIQYLESGVYIYKSSTGSYDDAQTAVGLASGKRDVDLDASFTINFNVDENNIETTVRKWSYDPIIEKDEEEELPPPVVPYEPVPLMDEPEEEIIEEEPVPLAQAPSTGGISTIFAISAAVSGMGLAALAISTKRKDEE